MSDTDPIAMVNPEGDEFLVSVRCPTCGADVPTVPHFEREVAAIQEQLAWVHQNIEKAEARHLAWREAHPEWT